MLLVQALHSTMRLFGVANFPVQVVDHLRQLTTRSIRNSALRQGYMR